MKVKCIKKNNSVSDILTLNKEYEVLEEVSEYYSLTSDIGVVISFKKELFEIVGEKECSNMKVKCIDNDYGKIPLTVNKIYDVEETEGAKGCFVVKNDENKALNYFKERFELVKEKEEESKTYKTWEVFQMIENDKTLKFTNDYIIICFNGIFDTYSFYDAKNKNEKVGLWSINADEEWRLMSNEVSFEKVLNSNKNCRVEHELIKKRFDTDVAMDFEEFDDLIFFLSNNLDERELKEIIKNGKWYLED